MNREEELMKLMRDAHAEAMRLIQLTQMYGEELRRSQTAEVDR